MKRLLPILCLLAACDSNAPPPPAAPASTSVETPKPKADPRGAAEALLVQAETERSPALYDQAATAFSAVIEADPKDAAAREGRALARWRLALARGGADAEVPKDVEAAGDRPRAKALKALIRLVDGARSNGGWEPLAGRILKAAFTQGFPSSAAFAETWSDPCKRPEGELREICEGLAAAPDWPLAAAVRAALEGGDVPPPGQEGILWVLAALRQPAGEAMKTLESATGPDQGLLFQAQAQFLAAEGKFHEATGRMSAAPMSLIRAASNVAAGKHAAALELLSSDDVSTFAKYLKAAATLQSGAEADVPEGCEWLIFERALRRLAAAKPEALADMKAASGSGGNFSKAWYGLALWHFQDAQAGQALAEVDINKLDAELQASVQESLAFAAFAAGDEEKGAKGLVDSAAKRPTRENFFRYATMLRANRQWAALKDLASAVGKSLPGDPDPLAARAEAAFWLKEYEAAVETVTFALEQKLDPKKLLRWRALAYEELKKYAEAQEDWERLTSLLPEEGEAWTHRAWMRAHLGRWSEVKDDAERGIGRGAGAWGLAVGRFALAAESLHGPPAEGEEVDPASRKEGALEHLRQAVKTGAVEPSDLRTDGPLAPLAGSEEWKKLVESAAEKQKELKDEAKRGAFLGLGLDHGGGSVMVTATYRTTGGRKAGLAPGDILLEVDGRRVIHVSDVASSLSGREPGAEVKVKFERELRPKLKMVQIRTIVLTNRDVFGE